MECWGDRDEVPISELLSSFIMKADMTVGTGCRWEYNCNSVIINWDAYVLMVVQWRNEHSSQHYSVCTVEQDNLYGAGNPPPPRTRLCLIFYRDAACLTRKRRFSDNIQTIKCSYRWPMSRSMKRFR